MVAGGGYHSTDSGYYLPDNMSYYHGGVGGGAQQPQTPYSMIHSPSVEDPANIWSPPGYPTPTTDSRVVKTEPDNGVTGLDDALNIMKSHAHSDSSSPVMAGDYLTPEGAASYPAGPPSIGPPPPLYPLPGDHTCTTTHPPKLYTR